MKTIEFLVNDNNEIENYSESPYGEFEQFVDEIYPTLRRIFGLKMAAKKTVKFLSSLVF